MSKSSRIPDSAGDEYPICKSMIKYLSRQNQQILWLMPHGTENINRLFVGHVGLYCHKRVPYATSLYHTPLNTRYMYLKPI